MSGPPWTWGQPEVAAELACGGELHRVVWRWGHLVAVDHDLNDERALVALGGDPCPCLEAFDGLSAMLSGDYARRSTRAAVLQARVPPRSKPEDRRLGPALERAQLRRRLRSPANDRTLRSELLDAVAKAVGRSAEPWRHPTGPKLTLSMTALGRGDEPSVEAQVGRARIRLALALPVDWLLEVDGRGLAAAAGGLTLAVWDTNRDGSRVAVTALRWGADLMPQQWSGWLGRDGDGWAEVEGPTVRGGLWWAVRSQ